MNIGYIGLGLMGRPCAGHLLKAGHTLFVWARKKEAAAPLLEQGAVFRDSPRDVALKSDIVFLNVTGTQDVNDILFGETGIIHSGKRGLIVVDMSTISATATRTMAERLAKYKMELVDAPVSGGTVGAEKGTLTFMVGCRPETFDSLLPVLSVMGSQVTRIGESGAGQIAKSCNQIIITGTIAAVAEAIRFARAAGVGPLPVRQALMGGFASSKVLDLHGQRMIDGNYAPGFKTVLHKKDMGIVADIVSELGLDLPVSAIGMELLDKTIAQGHGEEDSSAMYTVIGGGGKRQA